MKVTVVDYGMGNLWSVANALNSLGANCEISSEPVNVANADALILPGVGSFRLAMEALNTRGLIGPIHEAIRVRKRKILGICLGFQMLAQSSTEDGATEGLGLIPGVIERFTPQEIQGKKLPHIGFNQVIIPSSMGLFSGLGEVADFYFVHSFRLLPAGLPGETAVCDYGVSFVAAYQNENVYGTQFHPEKSQTNGLKLLKNFLTT